MRLSPREVDKLALAQAAHLAQKRLASGIRLNHPEATALLANQILELISRRSRKRRRTICRADRGESEDDFGDEASLTRRRDVVWRSPSRRDVQGRNEISLGARTDLPRRRRDLIVSVERVIFTGAVFGCVPKSNNARCYSGRVKNCQSAL